MLACPRGCTTSPAEFALRRLREGDFRARLAASAAAPAIAGLPLCLVLTGIPWRTTWKYRERGYRHLFWDAGAIVANLLAVAAAAAGAATVTNASGYSSGSPMPSRPASGLVSADQYDAHQPADLAVAGPKVVAP